MKKYRLIILLACSLYMLPAVSNAQLLKKIGKIAKESAKAAVSGKDETDSNTTNTEGSSSNTVEEKQTSKGDKVPFDYAKYAITVTDAGTANYNNGEYFMKDYSSIQIKNDQILTTTVVGVLTKDERLSELGEGSNQDVAYIYENGKKVKTTTVGNLDKELKSLSTKYDWYPSKDVANQGSNNPYIKPGINYKDNTMGYTITFNGKTYGPYAMVSKMIVDKTGSRFFASVIPTAKGLESFSASVLYPNNKLSPIEYGGDLLANVDFTNGCAVVPLAAEIGSRLLKEKDEKKQKALQDKLIETQSKYPNKGNVSFFSGKKLSNIYIGNPWLDGNNFFSICSNDGDSGAESGLYLNGEKVPGIEASQGWAWCNAAGTNWAAWGRIKGDSHYYLIFKDGTKVPRFIHPRHLIAGNKEYIVWFEYNRSQHTISMCSKEI